MDGECRGLIVVLLGRFGPSGMWATCLVPETLILLADPVQLALQLLDAPALRLQELGLALDDVVELQEVLHGPVGAFRAGLHGERR